MNLIDKSIKNQIYHFLPTPNRFCQLYLKDMLVIYEIKVNPETGQDHGFGSRYGIDFEDGSAALK